MLPIMAGMALQAGLSAVFDRRMMFGQDAMTPSAIG
jgi:hypothetical protein